jgi:hypothetical protein
VTVIAVVGDAATTTTVAIAAGWPTAEPTTGEVIVVEADPAGGSLAGWLDTPAQPSLATIVANAGTGAGRDARAILENLGTMVRRSNSGVRFVTNAVRGRSAHRAVEEAAVAVFPAIAAAPITVIADVGVHRAGTAPSPALRVADVVVIVHRQASASAGAATVRIERLVETIEELAHLDAVFLLAVIGSAPFDPTEIGMFVDQSVPDTVRTTVAVAEDPLAAATIAGRTGVSAKRLRRLPLMRSAGVLAIELSHLVGTPSYLGIDDRPGREPAST